MEFFKKADWFNREGPYFYNVEHIIFIILALATCVIVPLLLRKKSPKTIKIVLICLWATALALDLLKYMQGWIRDAMGDGTFGIGSELPFYTCSIFLFTLPFALFSRNDLIKRSVCAFLCTISLFGGLINFFLSFTLVNYSLFSFYGLHTCIYHLMLLLVPMIMLITGYYRPQWRDFVNAFIVFAIFALPVFIFDCIFGVDYMYLYDGSDLTPFAVIADAMPHHLLWTVVVTLGYALVCITVLASEIGITKLVALIKNKMDARKAPAAEV